MCFYQRDLQLFATSHGEFLPTYNQASLEVVASSELKSPPWWWRNGTIQVIYDRLQPTSVFGMRTIRTVAVHAERRVLCNMLSVHVQPLYVLVYTEIRCVEVPFATVHSTSCNVVQHFPIVSKLLALTALQL